MTIRAEVLGTTRVDGALLTSPRQRALLAALLLRPGRVVSRDALVEWLWGDAAPDGSEATVLSHVSGLRRTLGRLGLGGAAIRSVPPGYVAAIGEQEIDVWCFRAGLRDAQAARDHGDAARAARLARATLELWDGPALQDVERTPPVEAAVRALEVERRDAWVLLAEAELSLGRSEFLIALLSATAEYPHDETVAVLLAEGQYRTGQQAEALTTLDRLRRRLVDDLGVDAGPDVTRLRQRILRHDPTLARAAVAVRAAEPAEAGIPLTPPHRRVTAEQLRGRAALLATLTDDVLAPGGGRVHVLHGLGGCGKTSIALELAHRAQERGHTVWWVRAEDQAELSAALRAVADALGAPAEALRRRYPPDVLWARLARHPTPWLLVLDNADDPAALASPDDPVADATGWLRVPPPLGAVLVTSREGRLRRWAPWARLRLVERLTDDDGALALRDRASEAGDLAAARRLARGLGGLPLAIDQAGAYLAAAATAVFPAPDAPTTFAAYLDALDRHLDDVAAAPHPVVGRRRADRQALRSTWNLSLALLDRESAARWRLPIATPLLRLLACLASAPIPLAALLDSARLARSTLFGTALTREALADGLDGLAGLGLVTVARATSDVRTASLHPLVREIVRGAALRARDARAYLDLVVDAVGRATDGLTAAPADWPAWRLLAPHCIGALTLATEAGDREPVVAAATAALRAGCYQAAAGMYTDAEATLGAVVRARREHQGGADPQTLAGRHELAVVRGRLGRREEAETELDRIVALRRERLGDRHPDTLVSRFARAELIRELGRADAAAAGFRAVLADQEAVYGRTHQHTLATRHELTQILREQGHHREAQREVAALLDTLRVEFGADHPEVLAARHNYAVGLRLTGHPDEAETELRAVYSAKARLLGPQHRETLATRNELAQALRDQGRLDDAEREYRAVLEAAERTLGPDGLYTLRTRHHLVAVLAARGCPAEAEDAFRALLDRQIDALGDTHPDTLRTRNSLASVLASLGRTDAARREFRRVLTEREAVLGAEHPDTVATRAELGTTTTVPLEPGSVS